MALSVNVPQEVTYHPRGAAKALFANRDPEVLLDGPAGTGKTMATLMKIHLAALKYPGMRALIVRKTMTSLTSSAIVTYREKVKNFGNWGIKEFSGSRFRPAQFIYPNGSVVVMGGMDNPQKVMSSEYDLAYANEAIELSQNDWESITSRLRYGKMPYQQLIGDTNPSSPTHWLNQRCNIGQTTRLHSRFEDNPVLWDLEQDTWTHEGERYVLGVLDKLTGVRRQRLRFGLWVAAEGQVYESWDPDAHVVTRAKVASRLKHARYVGSADWGWTNPGTLQVWAVDNDGRMILVEEIYRTRHAVEGWWVHRAVELDEKYQVDAWYCDPAEPQYIDIFQQSGLNALPANNAILPGITAVQDRLAPQGDGEPRIMLLEDCLRSRDRMLEEQNLPTSLREEIGEYVWAVNSSDQTTKDKPLDMHNHGCDAMRYAVASQDLDRVTEITPELLQYFRGMPGL